MIRLKTDEEIGIMKDNGAKLRQVMKELLPRIKVGMTTKEIDDLAQALIKKQEAENSFDKVEGYRWATCLPINEQVVHTPPSSRVLKKGDLLKIDIGLFNKGFHVDHAVTLVVGEEPSIKVAKFLEVGKTTLKKAIAKVAVGARLGEVSLTIKKEMDKYGYFVLKQLTGHGIGHELHEDPYVFQFLDRPIENTPLIKRGMVLAIEIIYSMGSEEFSYEKGDDWSLVTKDRSLAACFEHTVAVTDKGVMVLT